jgi:hypothetical protein
MKSIWNSIEVDCWSRSLDYNNYLRIHTDYNIHGEPLSEKTYKALYKILEEEMEDFYNEG